MKALAERGVTPTQVQGRMVTVSCGTREIHDTYAGMSLVVVRAELQKTLQIPEGAVAIMNGKDVPREQEQLILVAPGQLEFVQSARPKG